MPNVTISKAEYRKLKQQAKAYQKLTKRFWEFIVQSPVNELVEDFRKTDIYTDAFLKDLEDGLHKSSYFKTKK